MLTEPLTETTIKLHSRLKDFGTDFYITQRLKRKPQILRKLKRFSVRLLQLQHIGGIRIIFNSFEKECCYRNTIKKSNTA
jgi:(p)ppGpp synthase/HD superfamily hydrolase